QVRVAIRSSCTMDGRDARAGVLCLRRQLSDRREVRCHYGCRSVASREDFTFDKERNVYVCPAGKVLTTTGKLVNDGETLLYRASRRDCCTCLFKAQCCPKTPFRRIPRSIYEEARDVARALAKTEAFEQSRRDRKRVEMLFAHLKRILRLGRLRLRGPCG